MAGLSFGAKANILLSLLNRSPEGKVGAALVAQAQQVAERNSFIHSLFSVDENRENFTRVRREVRNSLDVSLKTFSPQDMETHTDNFFTKFSEIQDHFKVWDIQLNEYQQAIESFAKAPVTPGSPRPSTPPSSSPSKKESPAQRRSRNRNPKGE